MKAATPSTLLYMCLTLPSYYELADMWAVLILDVFNIVLLIIYLFILNWQKKMGI